MKQVIPILMCLLSATGAIAEPSQQQWLEPVTGMPFVQIPKGCFEMGTEEEVGPYPDPFWRLIGYEGLLSEDEIPKHKVCFDSFWLGMYEVRDQDWQRVMQSQTTENKTALSDISWEQAQRFIDKLNQSGTASYRLPTEAEWEYACLAESKEEIAHFSTELDGIAWYGRGSSRRSQSQEVGQLSNNAFGLYDMLGNVWEWTADSYYKEGYQRHALFNPSVSDDSPNKVIRGGSYRTEPRQTRCNGRGRLNAKTSMVSVGLRLVREERQQP
jgi:formylglycine-generating enzyme required for sulfatase activity